MKEVCDDSVGSPDGYPLAVVEKVQIMVEQDICVNVLKVLKKVDQPT